MRFKYAVATAVAICCGATSFAFAADMPVKAPIYKAPAYVDPSWTGLYIGGNIGYSWGNWDAVGAVVSPTSQHSFNGNGLIGGVQAGFNWQFNPKWLVGVEADYQWSREKDEFSWVFPIVIGDARSGFTIRNELKLPWFATARARLGYFPDPNWLVYVTGGLAVGKVEDNASLTFGALRVSVSNSATKTGWTIGGGVEARLFNSTHWSAKLNISTSSRNREPLHQHFGDQGTRPDCTRRHQLQVLKRRATKA